MKVLIIIKSFSMKEKKEFVKIVKTNEHCIRNYLKAKFSNWTSGNNDVDNLIQQCQIETVLPSQIVEWIPYNNLRNIKYLTKGGCSEIYTANWIGGHYVEWDNKGKQLKRHGRWQKVVLK